MNNYKQLKSLIDEAEVLLTESIDSSSPEFFVWEVEVKRFLSRVYGAESMEMDAFQRISFSIGAYTFETPRSYHVAACHEGIATTKKMLERFLLELEYGRNLPTGVKAVTSMDLTKVFIVHGHDEGVKQRVARILEKQGITPIILDEQANLGATIIEKFERHSDVGAAVCLFTADDEGKAKKESACKARARQNVVLETGYFMGKLGRDRLVIIAQKDVDLPSDMQGVVYVDSQGWEQDLLKELKTIGFKIDLNKVL